MLLRKTALTAAVLGALIVPGMGAGDPAQGLKLTLCTNKTVTPAAPTGSNAEPVQLTLAFTNLSDRPIMLDACPMLERKVRLAVNGPDATSVLTEHLPAQARLPADAPADFPVIQPGKTWIPDLRIHIPGTIGRRRYGLLKPGRYRIRAVYTSPAGGLPEHVAGQADVWRGTATSDEVVLDVLPVGQEVNGLCLSLEVQPMNWEAGHPVKLVCTAHNLSSSTLLVPVWGLASSRPLEIPAADPHAPMPTRQCQVQLCRPVEAFERIPGGGARRFTLRAVQTEDNLLMVAGPEGHRWFWQLAESSHFVAAILERRVSGPPDAESETPVPTWTGRACSNTVKVAVRHKPRADPTDERLRAFQADFQQFALNLDYQGTQGKPFYCLALRLPPAEPEPSPFLLTVVITREEALRIVEYLAEEGFLRKAVEVGKEEPLRLKGPCYTLTLRSDAMALQENLGWDLDMLHRLDGLNETLRGEAAEALERLRDRLSGYRRMWEARE